MRGSRPYIPGRKAFDGQSKQEETPEPRSHKTNTCKVCGVKTFQKDMICVLCVTGIRRMYEELIEVLGQEEYQNLMKALSAIRQKELLS